MIPIISTWLSSAWSTFSPAFSLFVLMIYVESDFHFRAELVGEWDICVNCKFQSHFLIPNNHLVEWNQA